GTCAMLINKVPRLACRTQAALLISGEKPVRLSPYPALESAESWDPGEEILVEPLPHLPVIRDLVVDMTHFFRYYREIDPVLHPAGSPPDHEYLMSQSFVKELEIYTNCILCGACFGACPVNAGDPDYLGPAALAKLYRFHIDPREAGDGSRLLKADSPRGWWDCRLHGNCMTVCPKGVPPIIAIGKARKELSGMGRGPGKGEIR
ncbi:MAG: 2Fe-2S iron-sulfur cluster-binding protein, partial [Methanoregulaceae archaeon]|nr:2Fe-2S iron-sulfur cluster-binding protein [Methanoregulaceae archaeon]